MARISQTPTIVLAAQLCVGLLVWVLWRMTVDPDPQDLGANTGWDATSWAERETAPPPEPASPTPPAEAQGHSAMPPTAERSPLPLGSDADYVSDLQACEAACSEVFTPQPSGLTDSSRRGREGLRRLAGGRSWWLDARSVQDHSALICGEVGTEQVECAWVMPLEALVPSHASPSSAQSGAPGQRAAPAGQAATRYRASLSVAEGLLEVQLFAAGGEGPRCSCLPFDLRAIPR